MTSGTLEREGAAPDSQKSPTLNAGDLLDSPEFPLIWTADHGYVSRSPAADDAAR